MKHLKKIIIVGVSILFLAIFVIAVFYKSFWKEALNFQKLPLEYYSYTSLIDTITEDFTITNLGENNFTLFKDTAGNFVLSTYKKYYSTDYSLDSIKDIIYKIGKDGSILDSLMLPRSMDLKYGCYADSGAYSSAEYEPFIVGHDGYTTWLSNGDKTIKPIKEIDSEKELDEYLSKSEIVSVDSYRDLIYLFYQNAWYVKEIKSETKELYDIVEHYKNAEKFIPATNLKKTETLALGNYDYLDFTTYPESDGNLNFMFFEKESYSSRTFLGNLGSPTGGGQSTGWNGAAYFKLQFPNSAFCFNTFMKMFDGENPNYSCPLTILQDQNFAIINRYSTILVKMNNNK